MMQPFVGDGSDSDKNPRQTDTKTNKKNVLESGVKTMWGKNKNKKTQLLEKTDKQGGRERSDNIWG